jgi:hypothetical protein
MRWRWLAVRFPVAPGLGLLVVFAFFPAARRLEARGGWMDPEGGFDHAYEDDEGDDVYASNTNELGALDGEWRRSSNSDSSA